jgi:hypothetical protein
MSLSGRRHGRGIILVTSGIVAVGVLAGGVIAGRSVWSDDAARLDVALAEAASTKLLEIPSGDGLPARGVFAQVTSTGYLCLSDAPLSAPETGGGGCNSADDPLGGRELSASLAYDGGPSLESVKDARVIGLASLGVASVEVLMSDGSSREVKLKKATIGSDDFRAFGFRVKKSDLRKGIEPTAVVARDASGTEIDRQTTGIGD